MSIQSLPNLNCNNETGTTDYWGNLKYRKYGTSNVQFKPGTKILVSVGSLAVSGGTNIILEYAYALKCAGADVVIGFMRGNSNDAQWHHLSKEFNIQHLNNFKHNTFDLGIMTWWKTVEPMLKFQCKKFVYFIQSLESRFAINSSDVEEELAAASTYLVDIPRITVALWLQNLMLSILPAPTWRVKNGIDKNLFPVVDFSSELLRKKESAAIRYLIEGSFEIPMKAVAETLQICRDLDLRSVTYVNPGLTNPDYPNVQILNQIPISRMYEIYRQHDVLLKMSRIEALAGPPLEAFHAGCTVIMSKVTGSEEYMRHGINGLCLEVDDFQALRTTILQIEEHPDMLPKLKAGAVLTAQEWPDIKSTALEFVSICNTILISHSLGNRPIGIPTQLLEDAKKTIKESHHLSSVLLNLTSQ